MNNNINEVTPKKGGVIGKVIAVASVIAGGAFIITKMKKKHETAIDMEQPQDDNVLNFETQDEVEPPVEDETTENE